MDDMTQCGWVKCAPGKVFLFLSKGVITGADSFISDHRFAGIMVSEGKPDFFLRTGFGKFIQVLVKIMNRIACVVKRKMNSYS
jgi:hypothetical protein